MTAARPGKGQWTVVAGFVALEDEERVTDAKGSRVAHQGGEGETVGRPEGPLISNFQHEDRVITQEHLGNPSSQSRRRHPASSKDLTTGKWKTMRLCSLATGVKCLGGSVSDIVPPPDPSQEEPPAAAPSQTERETPQSIDGWSERDSQLVDMHAEILARRELECLLMREMRTLIRRHKRSQRADAPPADVESDVDEEFEPFLLDLVFPARPAVHGDPASRTREPTEIQTKDSARPWFRLKPSIQLVLYTSHAPCGAASDAAHLRRLDIEDASIHALLSRLGIGSPSSEKTAPDLSRGTVSPVSAFRQSKSLDAPPICKKPSRADAPPTTAFSCSDKLGRWQWLGFQGGRLAVLLEPLLVGDVTDSRIVRTGGERAEGQGPLRLGGLIVGEDYEESSLSKIFGGGQVDLFDAAYSRLGRGLDEVLTGKGDSHGKRWLGGLLEGEPCSIWRSAIPFAYGRSAATAQPNSGPLATVPPDIDMEKLRSLPLPLLRDILLPAPPSAPTPFPVALSYHAHSTPQAIGPNGRLSGVTRDKKTKRWAGNSVARVARGRMWEDFEGLAKEYEEAFGPVGVDGRRKGGQGWAEASMWMEAAGPYAGWHARP